MLPVIKDGGSMFDAREQMGSPETGSSHSEAEMLIAFYFPDVSPAWKRLDEARAAIVHSMMLCEKGQATVYDYDKALASWQPAGEHLLSLIATEGKKYASYEPWKMIKFPWQTSLR